MSPPTEPFGNEPQTPLAAPPVVTPNDRALQIQWRTEMAFLAAFVAILLLWTFRAPQLPGEMVGATIGGFIGWIGGNSSKKGVEQ